MWNLQNAIRILGGGGEEGWGKRAEKKRELSVQSDPESIRWGNTATNSRRKKKRKGQK